MSAREIGRGAARILLMAAYGTDPLWHSSPQRTGATMIQLDALPLSSALKQRLRAWTARYDQFSETGYESVEERMWVAEGRALLCPLRQELGAEYDVEYFEDH